VPPSFTISGHDDFVITSNGIKYQFRFLKKISSNGIKIPLNPPFPKGETLIPLPFIKGGREGL
jgi:hypothetical protein